MKYKIASFTLVVCLIGIAYFATGLAVRQAHQSDFQHISSMPEVKTTTSEYQTHLPIVKINTFGQEIVNPVKVDEHTMATIEIIDQANQMNHLDDESSVKTSTQISIRGNSSRFFEKKSYRLHFIEGQQVNKLSVMNMPKNDEWILNGPFLDKSLMRNYLMMNLSSEIMGYAPRVRYCEVFINEEYQGLYLMMEPINQGEKRVPITKAKDDGYPYTSYIIQMDRGSLNPTKNLDNFTKYVLRMPTNTSRTKYHISIEYPTSKYLTEEKREYIERDFSQFERSLYSFDYNSNDYGYKSYIDVDSFVDYYIINEFFQNYDAALFSTYLYKDIRGKINIGPVWDFNNSMDNYVDQANDIEQTLLESRLWYWMLFKDESFVDRVIDRYKQLRKTTLNEEYLLTKIDEIENYLGSAIERNFEVWGDSFDYELTGVDAQLVPQSRHIESHQEAIQQVKDFITKRGTWLDENIEYLKQYGHESNTKKYRK